MRDHAQTVRSEETAEARTASSIWGITHRLCVVKKLQRLGQLDLSEWESMHNEVKIVRWYRGCMSSLWQHIYTEKKMRDFHSKLAKCSFHECTTCSESFPVLKVPRSNEYAHCTRDKKKRFSRSNFMDPGPVPPQLQVIFTKRRLAPQMFYITLVYYIPLVYRIAGKFGGH